jgi:hypothetical protein
MSVLVRASDVPAASRAEYVREAVRAAVGALDIRMGDGHELPTRYAWPSLAASALGTFGIQTRRRRSHPTSRPADGR